VEVRGFEPLTPCMPSAPNRIGSVRRRSSHMHSLSFRFIDVRRNSPKFRSTAEVDAEVIASY
jgi:hypothetical protein